MERRLRIYEMDEAADPVARPFPLGVHGHEGEARR
jgi:hypothetical protein